MSVGAGCIGIRWDLKFCSEKPDGYFEGYGAVFGNIDQGGDLIEPGAFGKSLTSRMAGGLGLPSMYYNHDREKGTVGVWEHMSEDSNGLVVAGKLIGLDTDTGKMMLARLKEGGLKGMSIGYRVPPHGAKMGTGKAGEPRRYLKQVDLREVSVVDDPMNQLARFNYMKSLAAPDLETLDPRALEAEFKLIMSKTTAVRAVAIVKHHLRDAGEELPGMTSRDDEAAALVASLKRAAETLSTKRN